ncbi:Carotenoid dioxygenase [Exophiala dermatitidis]
MAESREKQLTSPHYNNWPNVLGFDTHYEERATVELRVEGTIPPYASGTLFRTGIGPRSINTSHGNSFMVNHWFDGFSQIHRFQIHAPQADGPVRVTYSSRLTSDGLIEKIKKTGKLDGFTFAAKYDPCKSFFRKVQSVFHPAEERKPNELNVGVTLSANFPGLSKTGQRLAGPHKTEGGTTLCQKTDATMMQMLDPESLEPVGIAYQTTLHPELKGLGSAAHAKSDPKTGDVFNYNLDFGRTGTYRIFRVSASSGQTSILAKFHHSAAYLHSLFLTENYVVLCVWNSFYKAGGASILWHHNLLDAMGWDNRHPAMWFVVDKRPPEEGGRGLIARYASEAFYAFHSINAYEEPSQATKGAVDIVADLAAYDNMDVLGRFYLENLVSDSAKAPIYLDSHGSSIRPSYRRYRLPSLPETPTPIVEKATMEHDGSKQDGFELPVINPNMVTKHHRYMYGVSDTGKSSFLDGLVKYDAHTHSVLRWSRHGHTAGEPIFVPDPQSDEEDGGVLLSVVLDGPGGKSYLLVLDAKTMAELGQAHVDGVVGFGFHGLFLNQSQSGGRINGLHL